MSISVDGFIHLNWVIEICFLLVVVSFAIKKALSSSSADLVTWRKIKLISSALGLVGFFLLLLNFEQIVRSQMVERSEVAAFARFLETKFIIAHHRAVACSKDMSDEQAKLTCFDFENMDNFASFGIFRDDKQFGQLTNWQRNPRIEDVRKEVNWSLGEIDSGRAAIRSKPAFSFETRVAINFFATMLLALAIAGSIGEALFQLRQSINPPA